MDRDNSEGIARHTLLFALSDRRTILLARKMDRCLLCRRSEVNEAGLCGVCWSQLDEEEMAAGQRWIRGEGP